MKSGIGSGEVHDTTKEPNGCIRTVDRVGGATVPDATFVGHGIFIGTGTTIANSLGSPS